MIKGLKLPVKYESGVIVDREGKTIIKAEREVGVSPLSPSERDSLLKLVSKLINKELNESLNEAQIGDKVILGKERGYLIGQSSDGDWIVQIQGSTKKVKEKEVKVISARATEVKPHMKFDPRTQKVLFEQFIRCGIFHKSVPIKTSDCYIKYSEWLSKDGDRVNVIIEGESNLMPREQVRILEDPNDFANIDNYVEGVEINEITGEAISNILIHAGDYTEALAAADPVRILRSVEGSDPVIETLPKSNIKTLTI